MRWVASVACVALALATAACDPAKDRAYFLDGVGTKLSSADLGEETTLQDQYIGSLCEQAGAPFVETTSGRTCDVGNWTSIVQAGMNDIDRRCDAYLAWLDARRRDKEPILNEISAIGTATHEIMVVSGVGTAPLAIVTQAFGLATQTYTNWNSRLLLEVNQSTVQTLVYSRQSDFRNAIANESVPDRPRAIYLLRNYLRICMPITIETDINTSITLVQRGAPMAAKESSVVQTAKSPLTLDVTRPIVPSTRPVTILDPIKGTAEESVPYLQGRKIQRALCVKTANGDFGPPTSDTRMHLREFKAALRVKPVDEQKGVLENAADRADAYNAVDMFPSCSRAGFSTAYEVGAFTKFGAAGVRKMLVTGLRAVTGAEAAKSAEIAKKLEAPSQPKAPVMNDDIRAAIRILSKQYGLPEQQTIDFPFLSKLVDRTAL